MKNKHLQPANLKQGPGPPADRRLSSNHVISHGGASAGVSGVSAPRAAFVGRGIDALYISVHIVRQLWVMA